MEEPELSEQLRWAKENPDDFHIAWECLKVIFLLFWGSSQDKGSLHYFQTILKRESVNQQASNVMSFSTMD